MNNAEKIILISAAGTGLLAVLKKRQDLHRIGKIVDTYRIKPGGRVDAYWIKPLLKSGYLGRTAHSERKLKHYTNPESAVEHFNLHALEFGNWMNQSDRANFMFASLVSLADMAEVMNFPHKKMGLDRMLSLSFGARGRGGSAKAFFQSNPLFVINLTKPSGKDSLAHEFGHALDNYLHIKHNGSNGFVTGSGVRHTTVLDGLDKNSVEYYFEKVFDCLLWKDNGQPTKYKEWLDDMKSKYLSSRVELWARTFEGYMNMKFKEKGIVNGWAVKINSPSHIPPKKLLLKADPYIRKIISAAR